MNIEERIAEVLERQGVGDEHLVDWWSRPDRLASMLVAELGLREQTINGHMDEAGFINVLVADGQAHQYIRYVTAWERTK